MQPSEQLRVVVPVHWSDYTRAEPLALPTLPGGGLLDPMSASPDGSLFLVDPSVSSDGHEDVVDVQGHLVQRLDPEPLYFWGPEGQSLCVLHHSGGQVDDMRLGVISLPDGHERDFYRFHPESGVALHGILACSPDHDRVVVEEMIANGSAMDTAKSLGRAPTVASLVVLSFAGNVVAKYDLASNGVYVIASSDGTLFAENPADLTKPAVVREVNTGAVVTTLQGQTVRAFDGQSETVVTVPSQSAIGPEEAPVAIKLVQLKTMRVIWKEQGYFRGALAWRGQGKLVVGVAAQPKTTRSGYDLVGLDTQGRAVLLSHNVFFG